MNKTVPTKLTCALVGLFALGNATIFLPKEAGGGGAFLGLTLSFLIGFILLPILRNFNHTNLFSKKTGKTVAVFLCLFALICATNSAADFSLVANKKNLSSENYFIFSLSFSALVFFLLRAKKQVIFKISLIFLVLIIFSQLVLFLLSGNQFNLNNLKGLGFSSTLSGLFFFFAKCIAPMLLLPFIIKMEKSTPKGIALGMLFGFLLILFPLLQVILIFGFPYSASLDFAFLSVLDTVSLGLKFSRLEGLAYIIFFFGSLIKCAVCLICAKEILNLAFKKQIKHLPLVLSIILFIVIIFSQTVVKFSTLLNWVIAIFALIFILAAVLLKSHTHFQCKTR